LCLLVAAVVAAACSHQAPKPPAPARGPAPAGERQAAAGGPRRRVPPNPVVQDSVRRATVDSILATIAGREAEPAGKVFKNVKLLGELSAAAFLKNMDENYGRGLGWTCGNCHTPNEPFSSDGRKNKRIARQMQKLTNLINQSVLPKVKELDAEYDKVTCVMCHRGSNEPKGDMAVPAPPASVPRQ
jgi:hypothetical protein